MQQTFDKYVYRLLLLLAALTLAIGTVIYHFVEKFPWVDAYYFSVVTLATVGYGDYVPHTTFGKIFTTLYIFTGVGILTAFISYTFRHRVNKAEERRASKQKIKSK